MSDYSYLVPWTTIMTMNLSVILLLMIMITDNYFRYIITCGILLPIILNLSGIFLLVFNNISGQTLFIIQFHLISMIIILAGYLMMITVNYDYYHEFFSIISWGIGVDIIYMFLSVSIIYDKSN
jgi:hypothetical protein